MNYGELKDVVESVNTGAMLPDSINQIVKLVLGKIARRKLPAMVRLGEITTNGLTQFNLGTALCLPGFVDLKTDGENNNRCVYYLRDGSSPVFLVMTSNSRFAQETSGGYATIIGRQLNIKQPVGEVVPTKLYVPYYSKYLVLDADGTTEKEAPTANEDEFLIGSEFDDVLVDGVKLYIARREKNSKDFMQDLDAWNRQLEEVIYYS